MAREIETVEPRPSQCYFVMLTEPNREMTAQANLIIRGIPFYLPTIFRSGRLTTKLHAMKAERPDIPLPLFPRAIFVAEDVIARKGVIDLIKKAPGMQENPFLRFGSLPDGSPQFALLRPLGMAAILEIESKERERYFSRKRKVGAPSWLPNIGDQVRYLIDKALAGVEGVVSDVDDKGRITILTEIMKRTVRVHATANQIEPV